MARRVARLLIDTVAALAVIAVGCVNQSFEVGSMNGATAGQSSLTGDIPSSSSGSYNQPQGGSSAATGSIVGSIVAGGAAASHTGGSASGGSAPTAGASVMPGAGGDSAVAPTGALLDTTAWRATASNTFPDIDPGVVLDPQATPAWTSGAYQTPGMWFQLDMRAPQLFYQIEIDSTSMPGDAAAALSVSISLDGSFNEPAVAGEVLGTAQTIIRFAEPQYAQYIRLTLTRSSTSWWSIDAIRVRQ